MLSKTKKIALLTTGLVGALVTSSAVGVALSSCTTTSTSTDENTKYNTYINWSDPSALANLVVDENGLVYSDIYKTTIIAVTPSFTGTTITIPASVRSITGYTEVLPSGATITRGAFQATASTTVTTSSGSTTVNGVTLNNSISTVKFAAGSQLKSIGANAFNGCTLLQSIDLPTTVTMIGASAFSGCTLLSSINLTNVEYVGASAFLNVATSLASPTISVSLNKAVVIGANAFQNAKITSVDLSANTSLISLGNYAFSGCTSLTGTIDLSKATSLLNTGTYTFQNCSGITAVNLPSSLVTIGDFAFSGCSSIANTIDLSGATSLSTIGASAFANCTKLTGLSYPTSAPITSFGASAFSGCSALTQLGTVANTFTAPAAMTSIAANTFSGTQIQAVDISNMTATSPFAASALAGMTALTSVKFNTQIAVLPANLFNGDTSLTTIKLPASITTVVTEGGSAAPTTGNNYSAFYGSSLTTVDMSEITSYSTSTTSGASTTVPAYLFAGVATLKDVTLKTGTTAIGSYAFQGTTALNSVKEASQTTVTTGYTTMGTLTSIGTYAFNESGLPSLTVSATTPVGEGDSATAPNFTLGASAFRDATGLKTVDLSKATGLTTIDTYAFGGATALTTVTLPATSSTFTTLTINEGAFSNVSALTAIDFTGYTTLTIGVNNFTNASALTSIKLPSLTAIPQFISTTNETAVFTGLPSTAVVQLSSAINTISNPAVFTQTKAADASSYTRVSLEYPSGITASSTQLASGVLSNVAVLSNVSGALDLSANTTLTSLGVSTLFGNATITSLTLPTASITADTNMFTLKSTVTAVDPTSASTTSQYTTENVPLGNNTALTSINFNTWSTAANVVGPGALSQTIFTAIAKIMNSYAYYAPAAASAQATAADSVNFKSWSTSNNSWIQTDATLTYTAGSNNSGGTVAFTNITATETGNSTVPTSLQLTNGTSKSYVLTHNGIKWNLVYNSTTESLTLTTDSSTPANIYKGYVSSSSSLQVYVKANADGTINTSGVQVAMSINLKG